MGKSYKKKLPYKWALWITLWTFLVAVAISFAAQLLLGHIESLIIAFIILLLIIFVGILADVIGIAATAAAEEPFHAKASKRVTGAKEAIFFVRNADIVSNFSNDVVGDISGIISGTVGALIVFQINVYNPEINLLTLSILLTALIAALTVGGKALGKTLAISRATEIILIVSVVVNKIKKILRMTR